MRRFLTRAQSLASVCWLLLSVGCAEPAPAPPPPLVQAPPASLLTPPCTFLERAFRSGAEPPQVISRVEPDFRGLSLPAGERYVILDARIDLEGRVAEACILRGVAPDIDARVVEAVRRWRFEPARLKPGVVVEGERLRPGAAVPVIMTLSVRVSPN
jgi:TonB family protein